MSVSPRIRRGKRPGRLSPSRPDPARGVPVGIARGPEQDAMLALFHAMAPPIPGGGRLVNPQLIDLKPRRVHVPCTLLFPPAVYAWEGRLFGMAVFEKPGHPGRAGVLLRPLPLDGPWPNPYTGLQVEAPDRVASGILRHILLNGRPTDMEVTV